MYIIGLTGGIASGKSLISDELKRLGAKVVCADYIARQAVLKDSRGAKEIKSEFGNEVFFDSGELNRKALAEIVFKSKKKRLLLNSILHPIIVDMINNILESWRNDGVSIAVVDAALLIEANMVDLVDEVWLVTAERKTRASRIVERDGISIDLAYDRINSQLSDEEKIKLADVVLVNDTSVNDIISKVKEQWDRLYSNEKVNLNK